MIQITDKLELVKEHNGSINVKEYEGFGYIVKVTDFIDEKTISFTPLNVPAPKINMLSGEKYSFSFWGNALEEEMETYIIMCGAAVDLVHYIQKNNIF